MSSRGPSKSEPQGRAQGTQTPPSPHQGSKHSDHMEVLQPLTQALHMEAATPTPCHV